jgi:serine/threonine protein kinase
LCQNSFQWRLAFRAAQSIRVESLARFGYGLAAFRFVSGSSLCLGAAESGISNVSPAPGQQAPGGPKILHQNRSTDLVRGRTDMTGRTVSHYRILEKLGGGGMGVVYKAEDTKLHRFVALKLLPESLAKDHQALEASGARPSPLPPSITSTSGTIYDINDDEGQPFIAMELLEGHTLRQRIEGKLSGNLRFIPTGPNWAA